MTINVLNLSGVQSKIRGIPKQAKFAASRTINDCLVATQKHTTEKLLPSEYTIRSNWFRPGSRYGFNARFAKPANLVGTMGTRADWMELHEEGGTKRPTKARNVSIPEAARPSETAKIPRRLKPSALLQRKNAFVVRTPEGLSLLLQRNRKTGRATVMYVFKPEVGIQPTFRFVPENKRLVLGMYQKRFTENFQKAMSTAK
jgi:hypothetical protein